MSCYGSSNGQAIVSALGGTSPYTYSWSPSGGSTATATGLAAGSYSISVMDMYGCSLSSSLIITQPGMVACIIVFAVWIDMDSTPYS